MREERTPEGRAFHENDHAICVASTLSAPRPKDGRRAKRKPYSPLAGLTLRCASPRQRAGSWGTFRQERKTALRAASNCLDPLCALCNDASHRDGSTQAGASPQSYSTPTAERQPGDRRRPATEWKAACSILVLNHRSLCNRKKHATFVLQIGHPQILLTTQLVWPKIKFRKVACF